ncbi:MAG TPA: hydroxymethylglutaryl-CoA lyase [Polyangiaceae bacterium]|nr:hydroxymethylglutaryl-CoA lyase [Polyangiaceae bacterium]HMR74960.1 hydroxymethylglutaryl-CoA lyase [Polyangiaceae bacterium]
MLTSLPDRVSVYEVSPRDGLQNEAAPIPLDAKVRLVEALIRAGLSRLELTSFVSPRWVPQLADADELCRAVAPPPDVTLSALCPNAKGFERAKAAGLKEIAVFMSSSETHNRKNTNKSIEQSLTTFEEVVPPAIAAGMRVRAYVSTVWGCPYEGEVDPKVSLDVSQKLLALGCYQVSLGDTIGVGTPLQTRRLLEMFCGEIPREAIALHFHDTRGTALSNALVGLDLGLRDFDASVGGLGGCPYAPGAAGNLATEDLVYMLHGMGVATGVDLELLIEAGRVAENVVGRRLPGKVHLAGLPKTRG